LLARSQRRKWTARPHVIHKVLARPVEVGVDILHGKNSGKLTFSFEDAERDHLLQVVAPG